MGPTGSAERQSIASPSSSTGNDRHHITPSPSLHDSVMGDLGVPAPPAARVHEEDSPMAQLLQSPTTYTASYSREPPPQSGLRTRRTTTRTLAPSPPAEPEPERPTAHVADVSLRKALLRSIIHIPAVLSSAILIILSARKVYFGDLDGFPNQDGVFEVMQFAVKAHEILMTMSIAEVVLHRIRWDLLNTDGVPFGFLSAAYQLSDALYLISAEFWASAWSPRAHDRSFRRLSFSVLVVLGVVLSLLVGPSSGVLMIPKLKRWLLKDPYGPVTLRFFKSNSTQELLWPSTLPGYDCVGWLCPSFGVADISRFVASLMFNGAAGEVPFTVGGDNFYRWLISNATNYDGWTAVASPMMAMGTVVGSYWNWISYQNLAPAASLQEPQLSLSYTDKGPILQPLVQVQCSAYTSNTSRPQNINLPNDKLRVTQADAYKNAVWPVPENYTSISAFDLLSYGMNLYWAKLSIDNYKNAPTAGLIFVMPDDDHTTTIVPCSVLGHWVEGEISVNPKTDRNIHDAHSNPLNVINSSYADLSPSTQISVSDDWWSLLMEGALDDAPTSLDSVMYGLTMGPCNGCLDSYTGGTQGLAYRVSTILGMYFTDAIARYVPITTSHVVYQTSKNGDKPFAQDLGNFNGPQEDVPAGYSSWLKYAEANPQDWREMTVTVKRYGYAWSFDGILTKLATVALAAQAFLAIGHVAVTLHGRWTSKAWDSIGAMIALALRSQRPAVPADHGAGDEDKETWAEIVSVRVVEKDLELHFAPARAHTLRLIRN